jgi:septal ring factor EnvC (AmiA/AmiB activator)
MRMKVLLQVILVLAVVCSSYAQTDRAVYPPPQSQAQVLDPMANISMELTNISRSVRQLSERLQMFVDKFEKVGGLTLSEKQQRFIMGLEILVRSEQRVATLQKAHTDLIEKHIHVKSRMTLVELDLRPQSIERINQLEGSTQTVEIRENRRERLIAEQRSLQQLGQQIERSIAEADMALREAQARVYRLRRSLLPQIEREINESAY